MEKFKRGNHIDHGAALEPAYQFLLKINQVSKTPPSCHKFSQMKKGTASSGGEFSSPQTCAVCMGLDAQVKEISQRRYRWRSNNGTPGIPGQEQSIITMRQQQLLYLSASPILLVHRVINARIYRTLSPAGTGTSTAGILTLGYVGYSCPGLSCGHQLSVVITQT